MGETARSRQALKSLLTIIIETGAPVVCPAMTPPVILMRSSSIDIRPPVSFSSAAPFQFAIQVCAVHRNARRKTFQNYCKFRSVGLARGEESQHSAIACVITARGAGLPVHNENAIAAWWTNIPSPFVASIPAASACSTKRVRGGLYTRS